MRSTRVMVLIVAVLAVAVFVRIASRAPAVGPTPGPTAGTPTVETLSHGRFKRLEVYSPHSAPRGMVLLLSGTEGWTSRMTDLGSLLAARGALVVGIDLVQFDAALEADGATCEYPAGDLENLSHFIQAYEHLPSYMSPVLVGVSAGAAHAYATLAQAPANTFGGAVSVDFCPISPLRKPFCKGSGADFSSAASADLQPAPRIANPWVVLHGAAAACDIETVRRFVARVPLARLVTADAVAGAWSPQTADAVDALLRSSAPAAAAAPDALKDLPLVEVPATGAPAAGAPAADAFAIMLSGDGGWAGLDKDVAAALSADGINVIGLDSLRYFWSARTADGLAADLDRIIRYYSAKLGQRRVLLVGYSQGADVLPFAVNRLPAASRGNVALTAIMGMSEHALFEFHMASWVADDNSGPPTLPEVERMSGMAVVCIYGEQETDSLCPRLDPRKVTLVKVQGGHHFDGNYAGLAQTILAAARLKP